MTPISQAVSAVLTGAYNKNRLTQEKVAEKSGMSVWTLQKKLKARAPITATDLVVLSQAIGVDPTEVLKEAMRDVEKLEAASVSEAPVSIADHLEKKVSAKKPSEMTGDELDAYEGNRAANTDAEIGHDEPETT